MPVPVPVPSVSQRWQSLIQTDHVRLPSVPGSDASRRAPNRRAGALKCRFRGDPFSTRPDHFGTPFGMAKTASELRRQKGTKPKKGKVGRPRLSARSRTKKLTLSLTPGRLAAIHRAVETGRAESMSAYVSEAIDRHVDEDTLTDLLDAMDAELGPPSLEAEAWADEAMRRFDERSSATPSKS